MKRSGGEEESAGAPSVDNTEVAVNGGSSSENETQRAGNKRLKLEEKQEDRISDLPDALIQHILSFLPSTKQAVQTGILSKRWKNQWTRVPVLIFDSTRYDENFSQFMDRTLILHDCSKLKKFHIQYVCNLWSYPQLASIFRFATRKDVEELILHLSLLDEDGEIPYELPELIFENSSLVKLELVKCFIEPDQSVNWSSLKELKLECSHICSLAIKSTVSGCPLLESLELSWINGFHSVVIASKSLKRLIFVNVGIGVDECDNRIEISCPNLVELSVKTSKPRGREWNLLPDEAIQNVLSRSPLLHTLELSDCSFSDRFLIASKSLEKLVLGELELQEILEFEISCPNLEELNLYNFMLEAIPPFEDFESESRWERDLAVKILEQLQHVKILEIGSWFLKILSPFQALPSPLLNCKCLTLDGTYFDEHLPGVVYAINNSPMLEKLVIKSQPDQRKKYNIGFAGEEIGRRKKTYWNPNETIFNCPVSNLKFVKIIGLSKMDEIHKSIFNFVEFLLKNARMLEKIVIISVNCGTGFLLEISEKLSSFQRCCPHTTIELLCSD